MQKTLNKTPKNFHEIKTYKVWTASPLRPWKTCSF